ncbi:RIB43A-like with coiled-coils protein 2 isoform X5 [Leopardus geoffroyi]|uniref:RIB43A-like with coiled-coils protein 2 isoform X5 n=1 Tax=Leopardus geoffroyi TaxID=46844 RepID=UPI001E264415|nr:RIB43A-like with coiled-coils protein 2 isoform X5 [Leopardus geoffroyi]
MEIVQPRDLERYLSLAKRRHGELCRQKRIFNARNRIIGGDTDAWDAQVHDQKIREATEKARHETFAAEMRQNDKITCILEGRERRDRKSLCKAINDFQQTFQKPETRREFDLSDPLALRKDLPARQSDNDIRNTLSGMQKFMGEDLNFHERKKFQEEQNREWSLQQQRERESARAHQRCAEDLYFKTRLQFDETAKHLQSLESATRKAVCAAVKEFNRNQDSDIYLNGHPALLWHLVLVSLLCHLSELILIKTRSWHSLRATIIMLMIGAPDTSLLSKLCGTSSQTLHLRPFALPGPSLALLQALSSSS